MGWGCYLLRWKKRVFEENQGFSLGYVKLQVHFIYPSKDIEQRVEYMSCKGEVGTDYFNLIVIAMI